MSISSMTNVAFARRKDTEPANAGPATLPGVAAEGGQRASTASGASSAISAIATYIPTEIVTLYVSVLAVLGVTVPASAVPGSGTPAASAAASATPIASSAPAAVGS